MRASGRSRTGGELGRDACGYPSPACAAPTPGADYGPPQDVSRHTVRLDRIRAHWGDMLGVAGSLTLGEVRGHDLIRMLSPGPLAFPLHTRAAAAWFAGRYG
ncbi:Tn3 family transposase [Streptomyces virginiae]|uniref:Tn3 family transposase n=1 Tax=Streptomyces virginiae TaxID=1961 RepID=UPI0036B7FEFC